MSHRYLIATIVYVSLLIIGHELGAVTNDVPLFLLGYAFVLLLIKATHTTPMKSIKPKYLSDTQVKQISFLSNLMGKRILPCYFYSRNPDLVRQWQYNMCLQTSLLINAMVKEMLICWDLFDHYTVESYEGQFSEADRERAVFAPTYNHGWVYVRSHHDEYKNIIIDTARVEGNIGVVYDDSNDVIYHLQATMERDAGDTELLQQRELDFYGLMAGTEYYTNDVGGVLYADIRAMLAMYVAHPTMFKGMMPTGAIVPMPAFLALPQEA